MIRDRRFTLEIDSIREESSSVRTFTFKTMMPAKPGQFIMLTDFMGGEKPFSISEHQTDYLSVTIKKLGDFTSRLFTLKKGELVSIRGAYGSSFFIPGTKAANLPKELNSIEPKDFKPVLCGGGFGLPPLYNLAKGLIAAGVPGENIKVISAGRTEEDVLFENRFTGDGISFLAAVEEAVPQGNHRHQGTAAGALQKIFDEAKERPNFLYASGSDLMMKSLLEVLPGTVEYQLLFERYMKCAIGICGSCVVDPSGIRMCKEGPALLRYQVEQIEEFGVYRRTASGSIEYFKNRFISQHEEANTAETTSDTPLTAAID